MSSPVITTGFGTFGSVNLIPTLGFGGVVVATQPHGVIVRRGKTKLWPGWKEQLEEEARLEKAREDLLAVQKQISVLIEERSLLTKALRDTRPDLNKLALAAEATKVKKQLAALRRRVQSHEKALVRSQLRIKQIQEEEDMRVISFIIGELYD